MTACNLSGKTFVVTGAGGAIGRAICVSLGQHGANVVANDVGSGLKGEGASSEPANVTVDAVETAGGQAIADRHDITDPAAAAAIIDLAVDQFGRIDGVVNNAGIQHVAPIPEFPAGKWDAIIAINMSSAFHTTAAALPLMLTALGALGYAAWRRKKG